MLCCVRRSSLSVKQHRLPHTMACPIHYRIRAQCLSSTTGQQHTSHLQHGQELDDSFTGLDAGTGLMTVAGFGSLLSGRWVVWRDLIKVHTRPEDAAGTSSS
jgi:hypothetical protein